MIRNYNLLHTENINNWWIFNQGLRITMLIVINGIILLLVITYKLDTYWGGSKRSDFMVNYPDF